MKWNQSIAASVVFGLLAVGAASVSARAAGPSPLQVLDPNKDGTVDPSEAKAAASAMFDQLDPDHDGTLDRKELGRRLSGAAFTKADSDKDGTVDKNEYMAVVDARFSAADHDHDGTLDAKELKSKAGLSLLLLLMK